jgi:hypothetical protein
MQIRRELQADVFSEFLIESRSDDDSNRLVNALDIAFATL